MMLSSLPPPTHIGTNPNTSVFNSNPTTEKRIVVVGKSTKAPPYGNIKSWIPRTVEDYGDGVAFPLIHVAQ